MGSVGKVERETDTSVSYGVPEHGDSSTAFVIFVCNMTHRALIIAYA